MPHQNVAGTIACQINYVMDNNNASNIFHVRATGPITDTLLDDLNAVIQTWLAADWSSNSSEQWSATEVILTGLNSLLDPRKSYSISPVIAGGITGDAMPANVTLAVKEDVGHRGRGVAGRWFWVGFASSQVAENEVGSGAATAILAALNNLANIIASTAGFEGIAVPHLVVGGIRPPTAVSDVITGFILTDRSVDSQKDRLPFHKKKKFPPHA